MQFMDDTVLSYLLGKSAKRLILSAIFLMAAFNSLASSLDNLDISGFGRVVLGNFNQESSEFNSYDDSWSLDNDSLFGLRVDYTVNDKWSLIAQGIAHANDEKDSGIQWLYADYRPLDYVSFKIGRQRVPFFTYSDILDVGFAYPWITPPITVYTDYFFSEFDGVLGRFEFNNAEFSGAFEAYYGVFEGDVLVSQTITEVDVTNVLGVIASFNVDQWTFRGAYHKGKVEVAPDQLQPLIDTYQALGFERNAQALQINDTPEFYQISAAYENLDYYFRVEIMSIRPGDDTPFVPTFSAAYGTVGYHFYPFSAHVTYQASNSSYSNPINEIPLGLAPQLDQLAYTFDGVMAARPLDDLHSLSIGLRYDLSPNIALKAEVSRLRGDENARALFTEVDPSASRQSGTLTKFAIEWVF